MLGWALAFFFLALVAALFGFGGIASGAASIGKVLFFLFLAAAIVTFIINMTRGGSARSAPT
jgi:uncharacterized membrane protein YtjA (UPF0391 family)